MWRVIESVVPMLDSDALLPNERFELLSRLAQAKGSTDLYEKAFSAAGSLEGDERLQSMMKLLDDIDYEIESTNAGIGVEDEPDEEEVDAADTVNDGDREQPSQTQLPPQPPAPTNSELGSPVA
jgi:hypothetical protein